MGMKMSRSAGTASLRWKSFVGEIFNQSVAKSSALLPNRESREESGEKGA
jgi:hypothetical protein